ncbi:MAG: ThiF family adenylyltransferase [Phycisphaerales bacterium]
MVDTPKNTVNSRYARQERVGLIGSQGQESLSQSHACIIGVGALGCVSADLLVRAGVGRVTIIDRDLVELSNLHRQPLFDEQDALDRVPKALAAQARLLSVNSEVVVEAHIADFGADNALELLSGSGSGSASGSGSGGFPDVLIDGTDNFQTRYLINDCAVKLGIPYVYGGAISTQGSAAVFVLGDGACLRCLHPDAPLPGTQPTCESAGVVGAVSSIIASYQAAEAMKVLMGQKDRVMRSMLSFDLWEGTRTRLDLSAAKDPGCPCCGSEGSFEFLELQGAPPAALCGRQAVQVNPPTGGMIDMQRLGASLSEVGGFDVRDFMIRGMVEHGGQDFELTCFADGRAIVDGTDDPAVARAVYARYIGS